MPKMIVDLRSDTVTHPTPEMRDAMFRAEVGDDAYHEDPNINKLEAMAAERLGKAAAVYVPSGRMGNATAVYAHTHFQGALVIERQGHINLYERQGIEQFQGITFIVIDEPSGILDPGVVDQAIRDARARGGDVRLLCLENTHNIAGGIVMSVERMAALAEVARRHGLKVHLDGARIFNAATALKVDVQAIARHADSVMFCLSKGLAAPVGSLVVGTKACIKEARAMRHILGGQLRQAGVLAAPGIIALTRMTGRLQEDHDNARLLAEAMSGMPGLRVDLSRVMSNIFMAWAETKPKADHLVALAEKEGVRFRSFDSVFADRPAEPAGLNAGHAGLPIGKNSGGMMRLVTHKDVTREGILYSIDVIRQCMDAVNRG